MSGMGEAAGPAGGLHEQELRDLLDTLQQTVFMVDIEGRLTFANRYGLESFGYTAEELERGISVFDVIVPEQRATLRANIARRLAGQAPEYIEYTALRRDGTTFPVLSSATPVRQGGRTVGVRGFLVDISANKAAQRALEESEHKYRALVEMTATGFVILDEAGRVLDANAEYVRMTGHDALAAIAGRSVVEWTAPHDRERNAHEVALCRASGSVSNLTIDYVQPGGGFLPVEINAAVIDVGSSPQIHSVVRDISERRRLEAEMLRAEKLRSVGVLAGGIAHDFNNILTGILGNLSLIAAEGRLGAADAEMLAEAERATLRARDLTRQLLTFSRGGAPVRKVIDAGAIARASATLALRGRGTAAEFRQDGGLWPIEADEGQVGQVVNNLVINASQAMAGGGTVRLSVANREVRAGAGVALPAGRYVAIEVADTGAGIPAAHLPCVFDPYFTTKKEGSGLGLAVCYAIVHNHGGAIKVRSTVGAGTVFTVMLPATAGEVPPAPASAPELPRGSGRVLVMDDEEMVRGIAARILRALGYDVETCGDGQAALAAWAAARDSGRPFAVAIVDLTVPGGMGGHEAVRQLLALDPKAKTIVSSGYHHDPIMANYREHGFHDVVKKPFGAAELGRVVARVIAGG